MNAEAVAVFAAVIGVIGTLAGVLIGAGVSEFFAARREANARTYAEQRAKADRVRADRLEAIDQTHRCMVATLNRLLALAAGDPSAAGIPIGTQAYPRFNPSLVHDVNVQRLFTALCTSLITRRPGSVTPGEHDAIATVETGIGHILEEQRQRALRDEPLIALDMNELLSHPEVSKAYEAMNVEPTDA